MSHPARSPPSGMCIYVMALVLVSAYQTPCILPQAPPAARPLRTTSPTAATGVQAEREFRVRGLLPDALCVRVRLVNVAESQISQLASSCLRTPDRVVANGLVVSAAALFLLVSVTHIDYFHLPAGYYELLSHYTYDPVSHVPLASWNAYDFQLEAHPIATKTTINAVNYMLGDALAQVLGGSKPLEVDAKRVLRNGAIGAAFGPLTSAYYEFSDAILPPMDAASVPWKIGMDQSVYAAAKYSLYLGLVGLMQGQPKAAVRSEVQAKIWPTLQTGWRFWPMAHVFTYTLVPPRHRVLWVNGLDLVWITMLSAISQEAPFARGAPAADGAVAAADDGASAPPTG